MEKNFYLTKLEKKYQHTRWKKAIIKSRGNDYEYLLDVLNDAKECNIKEKVSSKYYSCAKFIRDFYLLTKYNFKKRDSWFITCCRAYPEICGGVCCCNKNTYCNCDDAPKNKINIDLCRNDRCYIFKFQSNKKFDILW